MKYVPIFATLATLGIAAAVNPANADAILPVLAGTATDPTDLHTSGPGATGADPVVVQSSTQFTVSSVNNSTTISSPIDLFFAVPNPPGGNVPSITSVTDSGGAALSFSAPTLLSATLGPGQNLYTQVGCAPCDNSLSFSNFTGALASRITPPITGVTSFSLYEAVINAALAPQSFDTVNGLFAAGTFIAELGKNGTTVFDTSFTNTGLIGTTAAVPAPIIGHGLLVMLAVGGVLIGSKLLDKRNKINFGSAA